MRGKVSIIKKLFIIQLFTVFFLASSAEPYKPYPVIFVHGLGSSSASWGAPTILRSDSIPKDSIISGHTYDRFLDYMHPYAIAWHEYEEDYLGIPPTYTIPGGVPGHPEPDDAYPNKTFLEVERSVLRESCFCERNGELLPKNIKKTFDIL
jgi:hypothetical protein